MIGRQIRGAEIYAGDWNGLIIRRKYKDFAELRRRWDQLIRAGLPAERVGGDQQGNAIRFANGAEVKMVAVGRIELADDFQGHQYPEISVDECTNFPFFLRLIDKLRGANRSPAGVPCTIFCTGNPGGPGHNQVKNFFSLGSNGVPPGTVVRHPMSDGFEETRVFIQSFLRDNRVLSENDPKYVARLMSIKDPMLRKAWLDGDWDAFIGQAFEFNADRHVIDPCLPYRGAPVYQTFDWGFGKPFSVGWWFVDGDGRIIRFHEWYGCTEMPDEGLRLPDSRIAEGIKEREAKLGLGDTKIIRLAGPDCFNKKPNYMGGGQGPSTADVFAEAGVTIYPGDPSRGLKIRQFRERLAWKPGERPMLQVTRDCKHFIRTIQELCVDEDNPEDIDTEQEDHIYDEACHIVMARPIGVSTADIVAAENERELEAKRAGLDGSSRGAWEEFEEIKEQILAEQEAEYDECWE